MHVRRTTNWNKPRTQAGAEEFTLPFAFLGWWGVFLLLLIIL